MLTGRNVVDIEVWEVRIIASMPIRWSVLIAAMCMAQTVATCMNACVLFARVEQQEYRSGAFRTGREIRTS